MTDQKTFVLDTNVLLHDPEAMTKFPRSHVVIPVTVLEEFFVNNLALSCGDCLILS